MAKGLDVGTSFIVLAKGHDQGDANTQLVEYKDFRDAFYVIKPASTIAKAMIEKGLQGKVFIKDNNDSFIILGQDAIDQALERNETPKRPMFRGIVSAKEKDARKILTFMLKEVVGNPSYAKEKLVFCVPAQPIDQEDDDFDVGYHEDVVKSVINDCGYDARAIFEAEALCYSELADCNYTGIGLSWGAGMVNVCIMLNGEPIILFSTTKSGDWVDRMSAAATGAEDGVVQAEKESGKFKVGEKNDNHILSAVSAYYDRLIDYTTKQLAVALEDHKMLPKFKKPLTIVVAGGTSKAEGFIDVFNKKLVDNKFPIAIQEVRHAKDPLHAVARGCLIAAKIL
jgi:hypothetical protein